MRGNATLCVVLWIGASFATLAAEADEIPTFARGASLYSANCGRCHNARGPGEYSDRTWPLVVTHMRVVAGLPGDQAREIEAFLRASNNPPVRVAARRAPIKKLKLSGEQLLKQYGCRGCHKIAGDGGTIGPSLEGIFERRDEAWVRTQIKRPRVHNPRTVMPELGLGDEQVTAIILELHRLK